jgi:hypothetical protein
MTTPKMPDIADLRAAFEQDSVAKEKQEKVYPKLLYNHDELTCHIYVNGTLFVLAELNQKEDMILHVNDNTNFSDFPMEDTALKELSEIAGFEVTPKTKLWEVAKAVSLSKPARRPLYH